MGAGAAAGQAAGRAAAAWAGRWVEGFSSDRLFARLGWVDPRRHPWRFALALSLLAGLGLFAAHLREGLPPSLRIGLLLAGFFIGGESLAVMLGFVILGGFLGLRPALKI